MTAYYNEIDPKAAAWLRELITAGHIAPGIVDERSIEDVLPADLLGYTQCHFFAGIGVWSYALRRAGWPDDRPVWTGSCPCQPFSAAGKGAGFDDERHVWPAWQHLIRERKPAVVLGEQVASKDAGPWLDLVHDDMEDLGYAFGAIPFPSAGVGAPHIRDRLYWVANAADQRWDGRRPGDEGYGRNAARLQSQRLCHADRLANAESRRCGEEHVDAGGIDARDRAQGRPAGLVHGGGNFGMADAGRCVLGCEADTTGHVWAQSDRSAGWVGGCGSALGGVADDLVQQRQDGQSAFGHVNGARGRIEGAAAVAGLRGDQHAGPTNGLWRDADWLFCRDGKWRPVEPGTFPLAHGAPARVGRLRGYGNAVNAEAATAWVEAVMEAA